MYVALNTPSTVEILRIGPLAVNSFVRVLAPFLGPGPPKELTRAPVAEVWKKRGLIELDRNPFGWQTRCVEGENVLDVAVNIQDLDVEEILPLL